MLGVAVYYGTKMKKAAAAEADFEEKSAASEETETKSEFDGFSRTLTVTRKKSFVGMATELVCYVDGAEIGRLKNGQTLTATVNGGEHSLTVGASNGALTVANATLPIGTQSLSYTTHVKMTLTYGEIVLTPTP